MRVCTVRLDRLSVLFQEYLAKPMLERLLGCLSHLVVYDQSGYDFNDDTRVLNYVLSHARHLKRLCLRVSMVSLDNAFKHVSAKPEELDLSGSNITDATIDVLCQHHTSSLRRLTLKGCHGLTRQGFCCFTIDKVEKR